MNYPSLFHHLLKLIQRQYGTALLALLSCTPLLYAQTANHPFDGNKIFSMIGKSPYSTEMRQLKRYLSEDTETKFTETLWFSRKKGLEIGIKDEKVVRVFVHGKSPYNYGTQPYKGDYPLGIHYENESSQIISQIGEPYKKQSWGALLYYVKYEGRVFHVSVEMNKDNQSIKHTYIKLDEENHAPTIALGGQSGGQAVGANPYDGNAVFEIVGSSIATARMERLRRYLEEDKAAKFTESLWFSRKKGLEIGITDNRVVRVFVHGKSPYNFGTEPFKGTYLLGIDHLDNETKIISQLGQPYKKEKWGALVYYVKHASKIYKALIDMNDDAQSIKHTLIKLDEENHSPTILSKHHGFTPSYNGNATTTATTTATAETVEKVVATTPPEVPAKTGCVSGNCYEGAGTYVWKSGSRYIGEYSQGKRSGFGSYYFSNGDQYIGEWKADKRHGNGSYTYASKGKYKKYTGEWYEGKRSGIGYMEYRDGTRRIGEWEENDPIESADQGCVSGDCKNTYSDFIDTDGSRYIGGFRAGKASGKGTMYYANGRKYSGAFEDGVPNGQGMMYYEDGSRYEGEWRYGQREGFGVMYKPKGEIDRGEWENNVFKP